MDWHNLRLLNGSQNAAFEELCCQLAAGETVPQGSRFIRVGAPDAGVECYWQLPDASEWGWQAKFFRSPPGDDQWKQIDKSIKTALTKHPQLNRYFVCLPIDRQDPRIPEQQWFMDKWNARVVIWTQWATDAGRTVTFVYWGTHELGIRLSKEEHRGRLYFWFHHEAFSTTWMQDRIEVAIANVGPRYSPELDVQLPIAQLFQGLGRTPEFYARVEDLVSKIKKEIPRDENHSLSSGSQLTELLNNLWKLLDGRHSPDVTPIDWKRIGDVLDSILKIVHSHARKLTELANTQRTTSLIETQPVTIKHLEQLTDAYWRLYRQLLELQDYGIGLESHLTNLPALLLVGEAGRGKTHLLCDVARHRIAAGMPTILLIGGQFNEEEPWSQIIKLLGLGYTREEFLGALEASAQAQGTRALILIDALNEGHGKILWHKHLAGFLRVVTQSPWLGVALSVRTSYESIIPDGLVPAKLLRAEHSGFMNHEYVATTTFFAHYGIQQPSIPLLVPEFQNPLFLKLLCEGLKNKKLTRLPSGLQGITAVFDFFIESVNTKLSSSEYLNFNPKLPIIQNAIRKMAARLAEQGTTWLPLEQAQEVIDQVLPRSGYEASLFRHLLTEGVIAENRFYSGDDQWLDGVHFAYERLSDHLIATYLLDTHLDKDLPNSSFALDTALGKYIQNPRVHAMHQGLIEAFSVQLPERIGKELMEIVPLISGMTSPILAFIESLIWRSPQSISVDVAVDYVNRYIINDSNYRIRFLNALLTVAVNPDHPLNADFLHQWLLREDLATRDAWWSIFLHEHYGNQDAVDRLIDWSLGDQDQSHIADDSMRLCGVVLSWFLTTSNRFLRDRATKGLVRLFTPRISVLRMVLNIFHDVNDPYVSERLLAVAYGCALRSRDYVEVARLAADVYCWVFQQGQPSVHILLRDYARGVIETALHNGSILDIDLIKVRPPYNSPFPTNVPTKEELQARYDTFDPVKQDIEYSQSAIWSSVMSYGDFARYVIGTNSGSFNWKHRRIGEPYELTAEEKYEAFVATLTSRQAIALQNYKQNLDNLTFARRITLLEREEYCGMTFTDEQIDTILRAEIAKLQRVLGKRKAAQFAAGMSQYLENPPRDELRFDLSLAQRWILQRVFELGWTVDRFGRFDRYVSQRNMRESHKSERMGKKYQWIAYHEFLAYVADNFEFYPEYWHGSENQGSEAAKYEGPWQISSLRDIDPSCSIDKTQEVSGWQGFKPVWWVPRTPAWDSNLEDKAWIRHRGDLPDPASVITVCDPNDNSHWWTLEGRYRWEGVPDGAKEAEYPRREIHYALHSYVVKQSDVDVLYNWMKAQWRAIDEVSLPHSAPLHDVYLGEHFWAPAFCHRDIPYYEHEGWVGGGEDRTIPRPVLVTTDQYLQEAQGLDCSISDSIHIFLPCKWLAEGMGLHSNGVEGRFSDALGHLVAFDPSVTTIGPGAVLVSRDLLLSYLNSEGYTILWLLTGEKVVITDDWSGADWPGRLNILGVFREQGGNVTGTLKTQLQGRGGKHT